MSIQTQQFIEILKCFEQEGLFYWINALDTCDSVKGYLITYFNL